MCVVSRAAKKGDLYTLEQVFISLSFPGVYNEEWWLVYNFMSLAKSDLTLSHCQGHFLYLENQFPPK